MKKQPSEKMSQWLAIIAVFILLISITFDQQNPWLTLASDLAILILALSAIHHFYRNYQIKGRLIDLLAAGLIGIISIIFLAFILWANFFQ